MERSPFTAAAETLPNTRRASADKATSAGGFDELRGSSFSGSQARGAAGGSALAPQWARFFELLGHEGFHDLNDRTERLQRQIHDNGVTYNVYADADGPQRPWSLDLFPVLIPPGDWAGIEAGVVQRARLLERIMADIYGPQQLLEKGWLPSALVHGHPGYLRGMRGVPANGGTHLHLAAFDLARGPDGRWLVVSQRTQAPSGLGYLLENRLGISRLFPEAFRAMNVSPLADFYTALADSLKTPSGATRQAGKESRVVLLTSGPYNETYFEHAYLARFLGLSLVEGSDLLVRAGKLYLKTLGGLQPVHGMLKRLDDEFLDPLELRSDSTLGVPGLMQVIRAGNLRVINAPGSAPLESSALLGFLPPLSRHLLGEELSLPSLATWWCGERAALPQITAQLADGVIKPTWPRASMEPVFGQDLCDAARADWSERLREHGDDFTVQAFLPLSQTPVWQHGQLATRPFMLRVFAVVDGQGRWRVLPGGLGRLAGQDHNMASMQQGGSSADVWVLRGPAPQPRRTGPEVRVRSAPHPAGDDRGVHNVYDDDHHDDHDDHDDHDALSGTDMHLRQRQPVTSRAAENLFWLGRYTERADNAARLARLILQSPDGEDRYARPLLAMLQAMAASQAMVPRIQAAANQSRHGFERAVVAGLCGAAKTASVGASLDALTLAASRVRARLSLEQWQSIARAKADFFLLCRQNAPAPADAALRAARAGEAHHAHQAHEQSVARSLAALESAARFLAGMTGAQNDRMTRDDGWRMLSIGRLIERLGTLATSLAHGFATGAVHEPGGYAALLTLADSTITFHAQYQQRRDVPALLDLLVLDPDNPRSLSWVITSMRRRLNRLRASAGVDLPDLAVNLPDPDDWQVRDFWSGHACASPAVTGLAGLNRNAQAFEQLAQAAADLSNTVSRRYFSHSAADSHSLGA